MPKDLQQQVIRKAWEDERFGELLRTNPRAAIAQEVGIQVPDNIDIQVHQEDEGTVHLVVPMRPRHIDGSAPALSATNSDPSVGLCGVTDWTKIACGWCSMSGMCP